MLWKCCTQYASKFGKLSSGHRTGYSQFSSQSQRKAMPKMLKLPHNLISGSSAFSKTSLNIRKFTVHILLKPGLENFEHYFTSVWDQCNCAVVWAFFGIAFLWNWNENWSFPVELFQILKRMLWKCCIQYASKFGKLGSGHRTEKGQFSFQSQRKAMPKNAQTTAQFDLWFLCLF